MKFSCIIQSFLGDYKGAATNRPTKLIRSVESIIKQTYQDFEIIVIADGCEETFDIIMKAYENNDKVECYLIKKQPLWSGYARNFGITKAKGDYIVYLDNDDMYGENHLEKISSQLNGEEWVWFNDIVLNKRNDKIERKCLIKQKFQCGTSNICHKRETIVNWNGNAYGLDDWSVVQSLQKYTNSKQINTPEYYVMHLPLKLDL